jgi:hypothetical protein
LAPSDRAVPPRFGTVDSDPIRYQNFLADAQRLRGRIYLEDGAIEPEQLVESRHQLEIGRGKLAPAGGPTDTAGCLVARGIANTPTPPGLPNSQWRARRWPAATIQGHRLRKSVEAELELARRLNLPYVELGGWALDQSIRGTMEA